MKPTDINIDAMLKRLHLANARRTWRDLVARAEAESWSCRDFLALVVAEEVAHRQQTRVQRLSFRSRFPFLKTIDDFDFTYQSTVKLSLLATALSPDFVTDGRSLVLHGKSGRGKTHIAVAIGYRAIQNGFHTLFVSAAELIEDLSVASRDGRLADSLGRYVAPDVLIVDEVGYLTYGPDARERALSRRQSSPPSEALDDLHVQQAPRCMGRCAARQRPRGCNHRSRARTWTPAAPRWAIDAHEASRS